MITINDVRNAKIGDKIVSNDGKFEASIIKFNKDRSKFYVQIEKNCAGIHDINGKIFGHVKLWFCWDMQDAYNFGNERIFEIIPQISNSNFENDMKKNIEKMRNELSQMENSLKEFQKNNVHKNPELEVGKMYRMIKDSYSGDSYYFYPVGFASGGPIAFTSQHKSDTYYIDIFNDIFEICTDPEMLKIQDSFNKFFGH